MTVTGVDDALADGDQRLHASSPRRRRARDAGYNGINAADVAVTNTDNDTAGITVTPDDRPDDDRGRRHRDVHRRARLSQPTADVTIALSLERHDGRHRVAGER